jgi:hypothetical protein
MQHDFLEMAISLTYSFCILEGTKTVEHSYIPLKYPHHNATSNPIGMLYKNIAHDLNV